MQRTKISHLHSFVSARCSPLIVRAHGVLFGMTLVTAAAAQTTAPAAEPVQAMGDVEIKSNRDNDTQVRRE